jgi:rhodanese-related sulfurtransferase
MPSNIDREQVRDLMTGGAQLVEVLPTAEFEERHLPGAISIPLERIDSEAPDQLNVGRAVVVYCWDTA